MSSRLASEVVTRRLKASGLVPEDVPVRLERTGHPTGPRRGTRVIWRAVHATTGQDLGVASAVPQRELAAHRRWETAEAGGVTLIVPGQNMIDSNSRED